MTQLERVEGTLTLATTEKGSARAALEVLSAALGSGTLSPQARVCATRDARAPEEGLALLAAYVAIDQPAVRQAILDAVLIISQRSVRERR